MSASTILRAKEVTNRTGLSRVTIWRKVRAGKFPAPRELGQHSVGWIESEVNDWLAKLPPVSYALDGNREGG